MPWQSFKQVGTGRKSEKAQKVTQSIYTMIRSQESYATLLFFPTDARRFPILADESDIP